MPPGFGNLICGAWDNRLNLEGDIGYKSYLVNI
jgi:hypothetical protein